MLENVWPKSTCEQKLRLMCMKLFSSLEIQYWMHKKKKKKKKKTITVKVSYIMEVVPQGCIIHHAPTKQFDIFDSKSILKMNSTIFYFG